MNDFTRVTVAGTLRRAVVVVPSDETLHALIPQLMDLVAEPPARVARPLTLVRLTGEQLDPARSLAELGIADGELLRLVRLDEAPPPPEVSDVTDAVSAAMPNRAGRWGARPREAAGAVAVGALALAAAVQALLAPFPGPLAVAIAWGVAAATALVLGLAGRPRGRSFATAAAVGLAPAVGALLAAAIEPETDPLPDRVAVTAALVAAAGWVSLLLGPGVGGRRRPVVLGSFIGLLGAALPVGLLAAGLPLGRASAVTAAVAVIALGLLPAAAMSASGLTAIDDRVLAGRLTDRGQVLDTLADAYAALTWTTVAVAVPLGGGLIGAALRPDPWLLAGAGTVALVAALRTRAFPLTGQVLAVWTAIGAGVIAAVFGLLVPAAGAATFAGCAAAVAVLALASPAAHRRARLRRLGTVLEALAVVALVPLLIGAFGVYAELLEAFR